MIVFFILGNMIFSLAPSSSSFLSDKREFLGHREYSLEKSSDSQEEFDLGLLNDLKLKLIDVLVYPYFFGCFYRSLDNEDKRKLYELIDSHVDIDEMIDEMDLPFLYIAICTHQTELALRLIEEGIDTNREYKGKSMLRFAIEEGEDRIATALKYREKGKSFFQKKDGGQQGIKEQKFFEAINRNQPDTALALLNKGLDVKEISTINQKPILSYTIQSHYSKLSVELIKKGVLTNQKYQGKSMLQLALEENELEVFSLLLSQGESIDFWGQIEKSNRAYHPQLSLFKTILELEDLNLLNELIENLGELKLSKENCLGALCSYCQNGRVDIIEKVMNILFNQEEPQSDDELEEKGEALIKREVWLKDKYIDILEVLIKRGAEFEGIVMRIIELIEKEVSDFLIFFIQKGRQELLQLMINRDPHILSKQNADLTGGLIHAVRKNYINLCLLMIQKKPSLPFDLLDEDINIVIQSLTAKNWQFAKFILKKHPYFMELNSSSGETSLMVAIKEEQFEVVDFILEQDPSMLLKRGPSGKDGVMLAIESKASTNWLSKRIKREESLLSWKSFEKKNILTVVLERGRDDLAELIISIKPSLLLEDFGSYQNAFVFAVKNKNQWLVEEILKKDSTCLVKRLNSGKSMMEFAIENKNIKLVKEIIKRDISYIYDSTDSGENILSLALEENDIELIESIILLFEKRDKKQSLGTHIDLDKLSLLFLGKTSAKKSILFKLLIKLDTNLLKEETEEIKTHEKLLNCILNESPFLDRSLDWMEMLIGTVKGRTHLNLEHVKLVIKKFPSTLIEELEGQKTLLGAMIKLKCYEVMSFLDDYPFLKDWTSSSGENILTLAIQKSGKRSELVNKIKEMYPHLLDTKLPCGKNILMLAIESKMEYFAQTLAKEYPDFLWENCFSKTSAFILAIQNECEELAIDLLEEYPHLIDEYSLEGDNAFILSIKHCTPKLFFLISQKKPELLWRKSYDQKSSFEVALEKEIYIMAKHIVDQDPSFMFDTTLEGQNILILAIKAGHEIEYVKKLVLEEEKREKEAPHTKSLFLGSDKEGENIVSILITNLAYLFQGIDDSEKREYYEELLETLLEKKPFLLALQKNGTVPLDRAIMKRVPFLVEKLLEKGASIFAPSVYLNPFFIVTHLAFNSTDRACKSREILKKMIQFYQPESNRYEQLSLPLPRVFLDRVHETVLNYVAHFLPPPMSNIFLDGQFEGEEGVVVKEVLDLILAKEGVNVNEQDAFGIPPISHALTVKQYSTLKNKQEHHEILMDRIEETVSDASIELMQKLIDKGADINLQDNFGRTPAMYAVNSPALKQFLNSSPKLFLKDKQGRSFYYYLLMYGSDYNITVVNEYLKKIKGDKLDAYLEEIWIEKDNFGLCLLDYFSKKGFENLCGGNRYDKVQSRRNQEEKPSLEEIKEVVSQDSFFYDHKYFLREPNRSSDSKEPVKGKWVSISRLSHFLFLFNQIFLPMKDEEHFPEDILREFETKVLTSLEGMGLEEFKEEMSELKKLFEFKEVSVLKQKASDNKDYLNVFSILYMYFRKLKATSKNSLNWDPFMDELKASLKESKGDIFDRYWEKGKEIWNLESIKNLLLKGDEPNKYLLIFLLTDEEILLLIQSILNQEESLPLYNINDDSRRLWMHVLFKRVAYSYSDRLIEHRQRHHQKIKEKQEKMQQNPIASPVQLPKDKKQPLQFSCSINDKKYTWNLNQAQVYGRSLAFPFEDEKGEKRLFVLKFKKQSETENDFCDGAVLSYLKENMPRIADIDSFDQIGNFQIREAKEQIEQWIQKKAINMSEVKLDDTALQFVAPADYFDYLHRESDISLEEYHTGMLNSLKSYLLYNKEGIPFTELTTRDHGEGRSYQYGIYLLYLSVTNYGLGVLSDAHTSVTDTNFRKGGVRDFGNFNPSLYSKEEAKRKVNQIGLNMSSYYHLLRQNEDESMLIFDQLTVIDDQVQTSLLEMLIFLKNHPKEWKELPKWGVRYFNDIAYLLWSIYNKEGDFKNSTYYRVIQQNKEHILTDFQKLKSNPDILGLGYFRKGGRDFPLQNLPFLMSTLICQYRLDEQRFLNKQNKETLLKPYLSLYPTCIKTCA